MAAFVYPGIGLFILAQVGGVSFSGTKVSASDKNGSAFVMTGVDPTADEWRPTLGHVSLSVDDRVEMPNATFGDQGTLHAEVRDADGDSWTVDLDRPGFPVRAGQPASPVRGWLRFPMAGGVLTDTDLQGFTGVGLLRGPQVHAAAAVWGEGTVRLNGQVVTEHALVEADALTAAAHSDDGTFRTLREARPGDAEVVVYVANLPVQSAPRGFLLFGFEDVDVSVGGSAVASQLTVPNSGQSPTEITAPTGPVNAASPVLGVGGSGSAGTSSSAGNTAAANGTFSSPGIPASPTVANNGQTTTPLVPTPTPSNAGAATPLPQTPAPANSAPATPLPTSPTPITGTAVPSTPGAGASPTADVGTPNGGTGTLTGVPALPGTSP
jgi:hypothetical protein